MNESKNIHGKYFFIIEPIESTTIIYQVNRTEKEYLKFSPKYTIEHVESVTEFVGEEAKRFFFIKNPAPDGNELIILTLKKNKIIVNSGFLDYDKVKITKKTMPLDIKVILLQEDDEYKDFEYTPDMKRQFAIIDLETTEEVKPVLYFDEETSIVRGKCKLKASKKYLIFELKDAN